MSVILHIMPKSLPTKNNVVFDFSKIGGPEGDRTLDLRVANAALSQLSHGPIFFYGAQNCSPIISRLPAGVKLQKGREHAFLRTSIN